MKNLKIRIAALGLGALVAGSTVIGAVALQGDDAPNHDENTASQLGSFPVMDAEPIVYTGGYGLFPAK